MIQNNAFNECGLTDVYCLNPSSPTIATNSFSNPENITLHVPAGSVDTYGANTNWAAFKEIVEIEGDTATEKPVRTINDAEVFTQYAEEECDINYSRKFSGTQWQSLYVPFSIPIDTLNKYGLTVAELNDTHQWDRNGDGIADSTRLEFFMVTSGSTEANYPYLIKVDKPKTVSFTLKNTMLQRSEENSIECSSIKQKFTFTGTYSGVPGSTMYSQNYYGMSGGALKRVSSSNVSLSPQRWYMNIENKDGSAVVHLAPAIRYVVYGDEEDSDITDIITIPDDKSAQNEDTYSLDGIRQTDVTKRGLFIKNNKVILIR